MARPRQPIDLVIAKGKKNLTKDEIAARRAQEIKPCTDDLTAPAHLSASQKKEYEKIAKQLDKLGIFGETDVGTLARYVVAQELYVQAVKDLRKAQKGRPKVADPEAILAWAQALDAIDKRVDRYFKQAQTAATALGLTISSRVKLVLPQAPEAPKENKFAKFGAGAG